MTELETPRLTIRPINHLDLAMLSQLLMDPEDCVQFCCDPFDTQLQLSARIMDFIIQHHSGLAWHWAIVHKASQVPIGFCDAFLPPAHLKSLGFCDIAFGLDKLHRNKGYMQEALSACLSYLLKTEKLQRIEAILNPANRSSSNLLKRLGFKPESIQRQKWVWGGQRRDVLAFALLASEFSPSAELSVEYRTDSHAVRLC